MAGSLLHELFGLDVTAGGLSHTLGCVAHRLNDLYGQMAGSIRAGPLVHADETRWWVGEAGWWLWVFARPDLTVYDVDRSRGARVVERMLGDPFAGVLVSDCLASYDPIRCTKQKCYAHHLRALSEAIDQTEGNLQPDALPAERSECRRVSHAIRARRPDTPREVPTVSTG